MKQLIKTVVLLLTASSAGCGTSDIPVPAPVPSLARIALTVSADAERTYDTGEACSVHLSIEEQYATRDSCLLHVRLLQGNASVLLNDVSVSFDTQVPIPYAIVNKTVSSSTAPLAIIPEAATTVEQTIRVEITVSSLGRMQTAIDTIELHAANPAPIEVRTEYDRKPMPLTEKMEIGISLSKANFIGSYTIRFTHMEGQGFCSGDYVASDGDTFAVSADHSSFRLAYYPTTTGVHRLLFTVSDGIHSQEVEIVCEAYAAASMEIPTADGAYIHTKTYEGSSFYTVSQWQAMGNPPVSQVDGIAFINSNIRILLPLHAMEPLPFCGNEDLSSAIGICYHYEPIYPGRWHLPDIQLLETLAFRYYMEPIRSCMNTVGGTLFQSAGTSYLSSTYEHAAILYTYEYYNLIVSELRYGRRGICREDQPCAFFPVREL